MITKKIILPVLALICLILTMSFVSVVLAQMPGTEEAVKGAVEHGWESGVIAVSILALVAAAISGAAWIGVRLFGKHDGIITTETAKVRLRWSEHVSKMEGYHLEQSLLCKTHADSASLVADTFLGLADGCKESHKSQLCMCAILEEIAIVQLSQHDSEGPLNAGMKDREDFARALICLSNNDPESVKHHMQRVIARKVKETEHHRKSKEKLEKHIEGSEAANDD